MWSVRTNVVNEDSEEIHFKNPLLGQGGMLAQTCLGEPSAPICQVEVKLLVFFLIILVAIHCTWFED